MKPFATIGDAVLHGGPAWLKANGMRPPPSSAEPDRGYIERPEERGQQLPLPQQTLVKLERKPPSEPPQSEKRETEMAAKRRTRTTYPEEFKRDAVRKVLADGKSGAAARVSRSLGLSQALVALWMRTYGDEVRGESKTLVSNGASKLGPPRADEAAAALVDALRIFIRAVADERVEEAMRERMKRLL